MEQFTHDCDKTLHFIPCPLCKYYVRLQAGACYLPRDRRKCYVCDICDHCKKAHDRQLQCFLNLRPKVQNQKEAALKGDSIGLLREFLKSLVPAPRKIPENVGIEPVMLINNSQGSQTEDELDCDDILRFKSISEPFEQQRSRRETKTSLSLGDPTLIGKQKKQDNLPRKISLINGGSGKTSVEEKHGKKFKGDGGGSRQDEDKPPKKKHDGASNAEKGVLESTRRGLDSSSKSKSLKEETPKSPRRCLKSSSKPKSSRKSALGTHSTEDVCDNASSTVPCTQKLTLNVGDDRTSLSPSKIMLNIHNGGAGVMSYALSNKKFIDNGYTKLPTIKVVRKLYRYEMKSADPELDWFALHKSKGPLKYDTGEPFAMIKDGHYQLFYRNGDLALDHYYGAKENSVKYRTVAYDTDSCAPKGERSKNKTILATFDDMGNGIVYDTKGNVRLEYNQSEGVVYDKTLGTPARWQWHNLNEPPELKEVTVNTELPRKDTHLQKLMKKYENITKQDKLKLIKELDETRIVALEKEKISKIVRKKHMDFKQFEIQMKAVKLNAQFSLHINRQSAIYLRFQEGPVNLKFNVGLVIQSDRYVDSDFVEVGNFLNPMERLPAQSDSLLSLRRVILAARQADSMRRRRTTPVFNPADSVDRMNSVLSKPLQTPFVVTSSRRCGINVCCRCR